jgi:hemerythrin-like domain-containing protein
MSPSSSSQAADNTPFDDFSQCHAGIVSKLDMLGELPALLAPATRAREIADKAVEFFREAIFEHHLDEERELFPAVVSHAQKGEEFDKVQFMTARLTIEHRDLETVWKRLESGLKAVAKGRGSDINVADIELLVSRYRGHARYEETEFLPLAQTILSRNANHLAALGMSLHMRHAPLQVVPYI